MSDLGERLISATAQALQPLVKRLLATGVPFGQLEGRLRELFVEVAEAEFALPGRRQTDSRVSLLTGINRKEVRRIRAAERGQPGPSSFGMNYATSLISRWVTDPRTSDRRGRPRPLPYRAARGPSFMKLARAVTADLAPRVLLDELLRSGAAELRDGDVVVLTSDAYVARREPAETLRILEEDPRELIETILRNIFSEGEERLLQRKVYFDNLGSEAAAQIRAEMRREGEQFLQRINRLLARYDRDRNPRAPGGERHYAGVGVYFFEAEPAPAPAAAPAPRRARRGTSKEPKR
ncbi:MAG TPA: DUF6502 family protein [Candidatus Dormibacteraeota bacterium]|nr:DUF6502 family protein [Candidatus Dormibacteraeota bacterium]